MDKNNLLKSLVDIHNIANTVEVKGANNIFAMSSIIQELRILINSMNEEQSKDKENDNK